MRTLTITLKDAVEGIQNVVRRMGADHQTEGGICRYAKVENGQLLPICIVGQFFSDLGFLGALLTSDALLGNDNYAAGDPNQQGACTVGMHGVWEALSTYGITVEPQAQEYLWNVQKEQDATMPWGIAAQRGLNQLHDSLVADLPTYSLLGYTEED